MPPGHLSDETRGEELRGRGWEDELINVCQESRSNYRLDLITMIMIISQEKLV